MQVNKIFPNSISLIGKALSSEYVCALCEDLTSSLEIVSVYLEMIISNNVQALILTNKSFFSEKLRQEIQLSVQNMSGLHNRQIEFYEPEEEAVITKDRKPTLIDRILKKKETALANGFTNLVIITASDYACTRPDEPPNTSHVAGRQDVAELENLIKDNLFKEHNIPLFSIFYLANHHYSKVLKISYSYFYTIYKEREKWQLIENLPLMTASKYTHQLKRQRQKVKKMESVLRGMVNFIPKEQKRVKRQIQAALEQLVLPLLEKLKSSHLPDESSTRLLENTIAQFTTVYGGKSAGKLLQLTQKELEICNMIRQGLTTKEIAGFLNLSSRTVENHRNNVCKKLGLAGQKMNLVTFLKNKVLQD